MTYKPDPIVNFPADVIREFKKISAEFLAMQPPAPIYDMNNILFKWDATAVAPFGIHAKHPSRVSLVHVGGRPAVRLLTMPGDTGVNGSGAHERCDLRLSNELSHAKEGSEIWLKHSVWFPNDYVDQPMSLANAQPWHWGSVMNFHDDADDGGSQGPLQLMAMPRTATSADRLTGLKFEIYGGTSGNARLGEFPVAPIVRNMWYDFISHILFTASGNGFCAGWLNGSQFMAYQGPTLHAGHGAYLKLANYHSDRRDGKSSAVVHGAVVIAKTEAALHNA